MTNIKMFDLGAAINAGAAFKLRNEQIANAKLQRESLLAEQAAKKKAQADQESALADFSAGNRRALDQFPDLKKSVLTNEEMAHDAAQRLRDTTLRERAKVGGYANKILEGFNALEDPDSPGGQALLKKVQELAPKLGVKPEQMQDVASVMAMATQFKDRGDKARLELRGRGEVDKEFKDLIKSAAAAGIDITQPIEKILEDPRLPEQLQKESKKGPLVVNNNNPNQDLNRGARTAIQKQFAEFQVLASDLDSINIDVIDDLTTWQGRAQTFLAKSMDGFGLATPKQQARLMQDQEFREQVGLIFASFRKAITGAAASDSELKRLQDDFLNYEMTPTILKSALKTLKERTARVMRLKQDLLYKGIKPSETPDYKLILAEMDREKSNDYKSGKTAGRLFVETVQGAKTSGLSFEQAAKVGARKLQSMGYVKDSNDPFLNEILSKLPSDVVEGLRQE